ncbi:MAG: FkbM family methyltransferase [Lachnospiraceae bacterium]|nr:FkbM family methyltransferase [Lachnospiraceae bacterium]
MPNYGFGGHFSDNEMREYDMVNWNNLKEWISTVENEAERFLKTHKENVFIYGAGLAGYWYLKYLKFRNVEVKGFIVSDVKSIDKDSVPGGLEVYSMDEVCSDFNDYSIIIGAPKFKAEIKDILSHRCNKEDIYSFEGEIYFSFIHDVEAYRQYILDNWNRIEALYENLADQKSKETLQAFIMGRMSGDQDYFINCMVPDQYYPKDIMHFSDNEVMVECGSNNGNTMLDFVHCVDNKYKHLFLFEPDRDCVMQIQNVISENCLKDITLIEKGAWNERTVLTFAGDDSYGSGHITESGEERIKTDTIDAAVDITPTFIKMDIEGAELNALRGGEKYIKNNSPKLAVCVYHEKEDILDIPEYIKSINPNYQFYLRHHNWGATETVLYAIPE